MKGNKDRKQEFWSKLIDVSYYGVEFVEILKLSPTDIQYKSLLLVWLTLDQAIIIIAKLSTT